MKAIKRLFVVLIALCVSAFIGIFAVACNNDSEKDNKEPDKEQGGGDDGTTTPEKPEITGGDSDVEYVTSDAQIDAASTTEYDRTAGTFKYSSWAYNSFNSQWSENVEVTLVSDGEGGVDMTVALSVSNTSTYSGTYRVYEEEGEGPPTHYFVIKGLEGNVTANNGDEATQKPNDGFYKFMWIDENGNCIVKYDDRSASFAPMAKSGDSNIDDSQKGDAGYSTGEGYKCEPDSQWELEDGTLTGSYTYTYDMVTGNGATNSVTATVTLSADGTVTVVAKKAGVQFGADELGYSGTYKVYREAGRQEGESETVFVVISDLKLTVKYDGEMGNHTGDRPNNGFINWVNADGNALIKLGEDNKFELQQAQGGPGGGQQGGPGGGQQGGQQGGQPGAPRE